VSLQARLSSAIVLATCFGFPLLAAADVNQECVAAFEQGQNLREQLHLKKARERFTFCAQAECWAPVRKDCGEQLDQLSRDLPTVVFGARNAAGDDLVDAAVSVDGERVTVEQGGAVAVDPGRHVVRFERPGYAPLTKELVTRVGERNRLVVATLAALPAALPAPSPPPPSSGVTPFAYILAGVGVVGLGSFAVLAASGLHDRSQALDTCAPGCARADEDRVRAKFIGADISLAVAAVAAGIATYLFLHPSRPRQTALR